MVLSLIILKVIWLQMYKDDPFMDKGTLKQLQNLINRTNVPKVVKNNYAGAKEFFSVVLEAHIIVAGLQFFGMNDRNKIPTKNGPPEDLMTASSVEKKHI